MKYNKTWTDIGSQIQKLRKRGMIIEDKALAEFYLMNVGYYRLVGYWWPMQADKRTHLFKPGSKFENAIGLYNFDRELRLLIFDVIERIEIGFRARLNYQICAEVSPWWFEDSGIFKNVRQHQNTLESIDKELLRSREPFILDHFKKYLSDKRRPPAWKTIEIASFGNISKLYANLKPTIKSKNTVAAELGTVNHTYLPSWLQSFSQIRNICAHHGRLWNKNFPGRPKVLPKPPYPWITNLPTGREQHFLYLQLCCMKYLLNSISPDNHFTEKIGALLFKYPGVDPGAMGIKSNWMDEPLWVNNSINSLKKIN